MSNDLMSCEALEKLIQQEIGELDEIQKKLNTKHEKDDLLTTLDDMGIQEPRTPLRKSPIGFGRPKKGTSTRSIASRTPKRKRSTKLHQIASNPMNLNKKNVRALVYKDRSTSKVKSTQKISATRGRQHKHQRELSISSDSFDEESESSQDQNQPLSEDSSQKGSSNSSISPNRSSKTLKKKKRHTNDIHAIQRRKTKISNPMKKGNNVRKSSFNQKDSPTNTNSNIHQGDSKYKSRKKTSSQIPRARNSRSRVNKFSNDTNMPTTQPIKSNKRYLQPTQVSQTRNKEKTARQIANERADKRIALKYQRPQFKKRKRSRTPTNANPDQVRNNASIGQHPRNKIRGKGKALQPLDQNLPQNSRKGGPKGSKKALKRSKKASLINEDLFNNDDLFAKLNQLTKLNKKIEKQSLIEDGLIEDSEDEHRPQRAYGKSILSLSDDDLLSEEEYLNTSVPNARAVESRLRKKIQSKKERRKQQSNKSFIEQQLQQFKEQRKKKIKPSEINYDRLLNPKHKKKPSELKSECTFQPMLSKKSLNLANKLGDVKDRLYNKKSINYSRNQEKYANKENTFTPKISAKSKYIDEKKGGHALTRHERLLQMGEKYSAKRKFKKTRKEEEEIQELKSHSFRPKTSNMKGTSFDVSLAERASRWAEKRKEKVKRKRQEIEQRENQICSFKPKINHYKRKTSTFDAPESLCSSRFMHDGIKNYFTRLEKARKMKREANDRLENWGRSKSTRKSIHQYKNGYTSTSSFQTPVKGQNASHYTKKSHRMTLRRGQSSHFNPEEEYISQKANSNNEKSISETINLLRKNLHGINIHMGG